MGEGSSGFYRRGFLLLFSFGGIRAMAEELEELCGRISLSDSELEKNSISEGEIAVLRERGSRCLVGRIETDKRVKQRGFQNSSHSALATCWAGAFPGTS